MLQEAASHTPRPTRLHLGCGGVRLDGWVNVDAEKNPGVVDVVVDLRYGVPLPEASCGFVYCEHFLEHLDVADGVQILRECRRVLDPGGILRVAMPSLDVILERAYRGTWREQEWLQLPGLSFIRTRAEMLNIAFRWWGHRWLYDREELHRRLREAGFGSVEDVTAGQSRHPELRGLETRADSLLVCEAS
ncbi:MAG: methyltransferase domain-containing protein [Deferrisomatales bacterium]|nr:methyltransferase domain-containing protein [Deferrisomatales bacterium]